MPNFPDNLPIIETYDQNFKLFKHIKCIGYCMKDTYLLLKKLETLNNDFFLEIICDEETFIMVFDNKDVFGKRKVVVKDDLMVDYRKIFNISDDEKFFVISPDRQNYVHAVVMW